MSQFEHGPLSMWLLPVVFGIALVLGIAFWAAWGVTGSAILVVVLLVTAATGSRVARMLGAVRNRQGR